MKHLDILLRHDQIFALDVMASLRTTYFDWLITVLNCLKLLLSWLLLDETLFHIIDYDGILSTCCGIFIDIIFRFINHCLQLPKIFRNDNHMMENSQLFLKNGGILIAHNGIIIGNIFWFVNHCLQISKRISRIRILRIIRIIRMIILIQIIRILKIMKIRLMNLCKMTLNSDQPWWFTTCFKLDFNFGYN